MAESVADAAYGVKVSYEGRAVESATATVVIDRVTQAPQLASPVPGAPVTAALAVSYTLPETGVRRVGRARPHARRRAGRRRR